MRYYLLYIKKAICHVKHTIHVSLQNIRLIKIIFEEWIRR